MIGNWRKPGFRYSIPLRSIRGKKNKNLFAAGRCTGADKSGWDLTRVIPSCAVTGEAAGTGAACIAKENRMPDIEKFQRILTDQGVLLKEEYFTQREVKTNADL